MVAVVYAYLGASRNERLAVVQCCSSGLLLDSLGAQLSGGECTLKLEAFGLRRLEVS